MDALKTTGGKWLAAIVALVFIEAVVMLMPHLTTASTGLALTREAVLILGSVGLLHWLARNGALSAADMGWKRPTFSTVGWGIVCLLVSLGVSGAIVFAMKQMGIAQNSTMLSALADRPIWMIALIALTAAISEEIVYRGIVLNQIASATGKVWIGALVSLMVFALGHLSGWGWSQVLFAAAPGLALTLFFVWKRDLGVCIIAHFLTDFLGLFAAAAQAHGGGH